MSKFLPILILVLLLYGPCSKKRPQPIPAPAPTVSPTPVSSPSPVISPTPIATPTPASTPQIDLSKYIPAKPPGVTATISIEAPPSTRSLSEIIQAAQDDPAIASVRIIGGGSLTEPVILRKYTLFDASTYSCDATHASLVPFLARLPKADADRLRGAQVTNFGCLLVADGVYVGGTWRFPPAILEIMRTPGDPVERARKAALIPTGEGTTILEPTFSYDASRPSVEVFQALGDACCSHTGKAQNITIQGFRIKGRQKIYDGGVRSTVLLGNCEHGAVMDVYLEDTASIGITAGGSALEKNNFARDIVFTRNLTSGVAGANIATINTEDAYVFENYVKRPGHHEPKFGGGVCGYDHETNSPADHTRNINVYNNLYDYEGAHQQAAGSAICLQDPYVGANRGKVVAVNNLIVGGRLDVNFRYMSNGLFLNGIKDCQIANNYIFRTGQNAIQVYAINNCLIQDNIFDSTGGGGNPSFWSKGMKNSVIRRNNSVKRNIAINMQFGFVDVCGESNTFVDNLVVATGVDLPAVKRCP